MYHRDLLARACLAFGVTLADTADLPLAGSPARSRYRVVIVSDSGARRYVLEQIAAEAAERRERVALLLQQLAMRGLPVLPYRARSDGRGHVSLAAGAASDGPLWMLSPYLPGTPLPRPDWVQDAERGRALGQFLVSLRRASPDLVRGPAWNLRGFVEGLAAGLTRHRPDLLPGVNPALAVVRQRLYPALPRLPVALCHGDYHPLNIIWRDGPVGTPSAGAPIVGAPVVGAVIDWEFSGVKPELYDVAMLVGCAGVEQPSALSGALVTSLLGTIREHGLGADASWEEFAPLVIATRLAWLSEWLRSRDRDMIGLELAYLRILVEEQPHLAAAWQQAGAG